MKIAIVKSSFLAKLQTWAPTAIFGEYTPTKIKRAKVRLAQAQTALARAEQEHTEQQARQKQLEESGEIRFIKR